MQKFLITFAHRILRYYGIKYVILPETHPLFEEHVRKMVRQVELKFPTQGGEFKRHQVLRAVKNIHPEARDRDIGYQIELAVREID